MEQNKHSLRDRFRDWRRGESHKGQATDSQSQNSVRGAAPDAVGETGRNDHQRNTETKTSSLVIRPVTITAPIETSQNALIDSSVASKSVGPNVQSSENSAPSAVPSSNVADSHAVKPQSERISTSMRAPGTDVTSVADESSVLWREAYEELRRDNTLLLEHYEAILKSEAGVPQTSNLHDQLNTIAAVQATRASNRQWRFQWSGKQQSVRDVAERVLDLTSKAADLVAVGMSFAPPYVSIPWAAVTALVPFMVNDIKEHKGALEGLEVASKIVIRYQMAERTFLERSDTKDEYKKNVMTLYKKVIEYQALAVQYFRQSTLRRLGRNVLGSTDWQSMPSKISAIDSETRHTLQFLGQQVQIISLTNITDLLKQQEQQVSLLIQRASARRDEIVKDVQLISTIAIDRDHKDVRKRLGEAHFSSGDWFIGHPDVQSWNSWAEHCRTLWLRDGVGTGKSSLTSTLVEHLVRCADGVLAFFYCSRKRDRYDESSSARDDSANIMRSIVAQFAVSPDGLTISDVVAKRLEASRRRAVAGVDLSAEECVTLLEDIFSTCDLHFTIVIDALDECNDYDGLLQSLNEATAAYSNVRLFFSSRLQVKVQDYLPDTCTISIQTCNVVDIEKYLDIEIPRRRSGSGMTDSQSERLRKTLIQRAGSMFIWVKLQLNLFLHEIKSNRIRFEEDIEPMLLRLENSQAQGEEQLYSAYNDVYNTAIGSGTEKRRREIVMTALRWVLSAYRCLTLRELTYATLLVQGGSVRTNVQEGLLLELCSNLVVEDTLGVVRLAHLSVRHFLESRNSAEYCPNLSHLQAAFSCLYFADSPRFHEIGESMDNQGQDGDVALTKGFQSYVTANWFKHCKDAERNEQLEKLIDDFALKSRARHSATKFGIEIRDGPESSVPLNTHMPSMAPGRDAMSRSKPSTDVTVDTSFGSDIFAKLVECLSGNSEERLDMIKHYIAKGFDLNAMSQFGSTLLHESVRYQWQDATRLLLEVQVSTNIGDPHGNTPLHTACLHGSIEGTQTLLYFRANVNAKNAKAETPLHIAITHHAYTSAEMLLAAGTDALAKDHDGNTSLHLATLTANQSFVETLLLAGYNPNGRNEKGQSALMIAIELRNSEIATLLLQHGASFTPDEMSLVHSMKTPEVTRLASQGEHSPLRHTNEAISDDTVRHTYKAAIEYNGLTYLCNCCDPVRWFVGLRRGVSYRHHESLEDLYASASHGCAMCKFLADELTKSYERTDTTQQGDLTVTIEPASTQASQSHPHDRFVLSIQGTSLLEFELCTDPDDDLFAATEWLSGRTFSTDPRNDKCLNSVKKWMNTCFDTHLECSVTGPAQLPTRLIDVGHDSDSTVRVRMNSRTEKGSYVYLSYRWGTPDRDVFMLRASSNRIVGEPIPIEKLAQTHRDAILMTRHLGYRYIWIDALCVLQDSHYDFGIEAPLMGGYLQNAALILVAASSTTFTDDLLRTRPRPVLTIDFAQLPDTEYDVSVQPVPRGKIYLRRPMETVYRSLKGSSLSRGWTVSEVVVPCRLLVVGSDQMYWHCRTHAQSEGSVLSRSPVLKLLPRNSSQAAFSGQRTFYPWYDLVHLFSEGKFTIDRDRAIATIFIARYFDEHAEYVAGTWLQDIHNGLLWRVHNGASNKSLLLGSENSWSWTSVAAPVRYDFVRGAHHNAQPQDMAFTVLETSPVDLDNAAGTSEVRRVTVEALTLDTTASPDVLRDCICFADGTAHEQAWQRRCPFLLVLVCPWSMTLDSTFDPTRARSLGLVLCQISGARGRQGENGTPALSDALDYTRDFVRAGLFLMSSYDPYMEYWTRRRVSIV